MPDVDRAFAHLAARQLFSVGDESFTLGDVLEWARDRGTLAALEQETRLGLACAAAGLQADPEAVHEAGIRFRRERGLLAGEQLRSWLDARELTLAEWRDVFRRAALRAEHGAELDRLAEEHPVADADIEEAIRAEALCSGFLAREAELLAESVAVAGQKVEPTDAEIGREVEARALDWIRVEAGLLVLGDADVAREAALAVRVDGRPLAGVAEQCGVPLQELACVLEDAPNGLAPALRSAAPGELLGPLELGTGFALVDVGAKLPPSAADERIRRRAEQALRRRRIASLLENRVRWHERL